MPLTLLLLACGPDVPDAQRLADALGAPDAGAALAACDGIRDPTVGSECVASVVQARTDAPDAACADATDPRWAGECWFTVAERRITAHDRGAALAACGRSGPFYDECLFHLWSAELDAHASASASLEGALTAAQDTLAFWAQVETVEGDVRPLLEAELGFRWATRHRPVPETTCVTAPDAVRAACEAALTQFPVRAVVEDLVRAGAAPGRLDRVCRARALPEGAFEGLMVADFDRAAAAAEAVEIAGSGRRPWNPVFRGRP